MSKQVALSYFGTKGGGVHFSQALSILNKKGITLLSSRNVGLEGYSGEIYTLYKVPSGIRENLIGKMNWRIKSELQTMTEMPENLISAMHHPLDVSLFNLLTNGTKIYSVIHDSKPHPGDLWPRARQIKGRIKSSDKIITLSRFSQNKLHEHFGADSICLPLLGPKIHVDQFSSNKLFDLAYFGRGRKYQGAENFSKIIKLIDRPLRIITNSMSDREKAWVSQQTKHEIVSLDGWVNERELFQAIASSRSLILPYSEASQSGWIPIARDMGVPVVCTDIGGLREQFVNERDGILVPNLNFRLFASSLVRTLNNDWSGITNTSRERSVWEDFLKCL